jgi:hypothetical protein
LRCPACFLQLGVVQALLHIVYSAFSRLHGLAAGSSSNGNSSSGGRPSTCSQQEYLAMLVASLGALGLLAVDKQARQQLIASRQGLSLLADVAALPSAAFRRPQSEEWLEKQHAPGMQPQEDVSLMPTSKVQQVPAAVVAVAAVPPAVAQQQSSNSNAASGLGTAAGAAEAQQPSTEHLEVREGADEDSGTAGAAGAAAAVIETVVVEDPVAVPAALLDMQPNQLAAEVLTAVLLRDAEARALFMQGGNCRLLLSLLSAPDVRVQLCGVAAVARMANTPGMHEKCSQLAPQEPQLLRQIHSSITALLETQLLQHMQPEQRIVDDDCGRGSVNHSSGSEIGSRQLQVQDTGQAGDNELQEMLLEYTCLALWVVTAAVAPLFTKDEVLQQLASAGQLAHACLQLHGAAGTQPTVVCCLSGVLCVLAATVAVPEAAAGLPVCDRIEPGGSSEAAALVQALQPAMLAVLQLEASAPEVSKAGKLCVGQQLQLAEVAVALLFVHDPDACAELAVYDSCA